METSRTRIDGDVEPTAKTSLLKRWALDAGFDGVGVASVGRSRDGSAFCEWLERGDHAGMEYMQRRLEVRLDPSHLFEGVRSVLCVAMQYDPLVGASDPSADLWPWVARYARGRDYHGVMEKRLRSVARLVEAAFPGCGWRLYVDTGPVLERELAAGAGLGAVGKNTNLLHPERGSWFLLGELFLTLEMAPDSGLADLCGSCTRCLEACPTGALPEAYRLDSNRCISYWTIEHRGVIPEAIRSSLGQWVFGCDICQEVCPLNADLAARDHPEFRLPPERAEVDLSQLLLLDRREYLERFQGSPMKRAKLEGLQRNAAIAMGNSGNLAYRPVLVAALERQEPLVRRHAAWALGELGGEESVLALGQSLDRETDEGVRSEIRAALHRISQKS